MIEWNFNMDEAISNEDIAAGEPFLAWNKGQESGFPVVVSRSGYGNFRSPTWIYSPEEFTERFTAWAHINPPVKGE